LSDTGQKVRAVILRQFAIEPQRLSDETSLQDFGADSMAMVELMVNLEEAFETPMPDITTTDIRTVGDIVAFIDRNQASRQQASL
jgi:acyl carrier protein